MLMKSWLKTLGSRISNGRARSRTRSRFGRTNRERAAASWTLSKQVESLEVRQVLSGVNQWVAAGPFGVINGQTENVDAPGDNPVSPGKAENFVSGAVSFVLPHPSNPDILFVAGVNGGVWRSMNATATNPDWQPLTDFEASLSVGAMAFDGDDPEGDRLGGSLALPTRPRARLRNANSGNFLCDSCRRFVLTGTQWSVATFEGTTDTAYVAARVMNLQGAAPC